LFGVPEGVFAMAPIVATHRIISATFAELNAGLRALSCATAPATCGAAIEVPWYATYEESLRELNEGTSVPGARRSMHRPRLEYDASLSSEFVAPTVIACGARAGE